MIEAPLQVVFDVRQAGFDAWLPALLILAVSIMIGVIGYGVGQGSRIGARRLAFGVSGVGLLLAVAVLGFTWRTHTQITQALEEGSYSVVEGPVDRLRLADRGHHRPERFEVAGRLFQYRRTGLEAVGFNGDRMDSRVMRPGEHVRIYAVDGKIARMEAVE